MTVQTESRDEQDRGTWVKVAFDALILLVSILFVVTAYRYQGSTGLFAEVIGYPLGFLSLVMVVLDLRQSPRVETSDADVKVSYHFPFVPLAIAVTYVVLFFGVGFIAATLLFLTLTPWLVLRQPFKSVPVLLAMSVTLTVIFVALFGMGSGVILPSGLVGRLF